MNKIFRTFIAFLIVLPLQNFGEEFLDLENLPKLRTKQYDLKCEEVFVFTPYRTGSTLLYNFCRFLFENEDYLEKNHTQDNNLGIVKKTHEINDLSTGTSSNFVIFTILRHPKESCQSWLRVNKPSPEHSEIWISSYFANYIEILNTLKELISNNQNVTIFNYDTITSDYSLFFKKIHEKFNVNIDLSDQAVLIKGLEKKNVFNNTLKVSDFSDYLVSSGFHGNHVALDKYEISDEINLMIDEQFSKYQDLFKEFGFE